MSPSRIAGAEAGVVSKLLLPFGGSTLIETAVRAALASEARAILVLGNRAAEIGALFDEASYRGARSEGKLLLIENLGWREGMVGSIQAALSAVRGEAFFISHADMPFIGADSYRALASAWAERRSSGAARSGASGEPPAAAIASWAGREGHPVLLPSAWIPEILGLAAGDRFKPFLEDRPRFLVETGQGALRDIDTPEDYAAAAEFLEACKSRETG
jgi:molybdenum cofactor cytidylyltransferase